MNNNHGRRRVRRARRNQAKAQISRILLTVALMTLVAVVSIGGTLAWLTDNTETITNTFTTAGIDISLTETWNADSDDEDTVNDHWEAQLIPGKEYTKDPTVTVIRQDEDGNPVTNVDIYLFVKFEPGDSATYLDYTSNLTAVNGWTAGTDTDGIPANVWYRTVEATDTETSFKLLKNDKVTVKTELAKSGDTTANVTMPSTSFEMKYTAYAAQTEGLTEAEAWAKVCN